jgi:predicted TIM-barrel enzyme
VAKDAVVRGLADGVIVSGVATGSAPAESDLIAVKESVPDTPLFVGSGTSLENISPLLRTADGVIVASSLKRQGAMENPVDVDRVRALVAAARNSSVAR